jgi:DNA replication protein DnaC
MKESHKTLEVLRGPIGGHFRIVPCEGCKRTKTTLWCDKDGVPLDGKSKAYCELCEHGERKVRERQDKEKKFDELTPSLFRKTRPQQIPAQDALVEALKWEPQADKPFLLAYGPPGRGKTRTAFLVARRLFSTSRTRNPTFLHSPAGGFSARIVSAWRDGGADELVREYRGADILLLDDIDKDKLSPRAEEALFAVINARAEAGLPTILTTNASGERIVARFTEEFRGPILRRLAEFSTTISFP